MISLPNILPLLLPPDEPPCQARLDGLGTTRPAFKFLQVKTQKLSSAQTGRCHPIEPDRAETFELNHA
jgi:hypothetical protein